MYYTLKEIQKFDIAQLMDEDFINQVVDLPELERQRYIIVIMAVAKANKVDKMVKEYLDTAIRAVENSNMVPVEITEFDVPALCGYNTGTYEVNLSGIKTVGRYGEEIIISRQPMLPTKILANLETTKEKLGITFLKRNKWEEIIVDKSIINSATKIVQLADSGLDVTSETSKPLVRYINSMEMDNLDKIPVYPSTSKLGWKRSGDFVPYAPICFDAESKFKSAYESIHTKGDREVWIQMARIILGANRMEPKLYLAGALASVMIEKVNALPFILNLWGETGKGKTVALMFAASIFADPSEGAYITDPKSTATAIEMRLDFLHNLPLCLDDIAQVKEKYRGNYSELIYQLCAGRGKERSNINLGLNRQNTWKNVILTNAEQSLVGDNTQGGAINRVIDVEMEEGYIFEDGAEVASLLKDNYGFLGREFVELMQMMTESEINDLYKASLNKIQQTARDRKLTLEEKQMIPVALLLAAYNLAAEKILDVEPLDFEYCFKLIKSTSEVSENERAYEYILSSCYIHRNNFYETIFDKDGKTHTNYPSGEIWGKINNGKTLDDEVLCICVNIFNRILEEGNFSKKTFLSWAIKHGYIETGTAERAYKGVRIDGRVTKCICLRKNSIETITMEDILKMDTLPES